MKFSCKSQTKESGNVTVSVARDLVPWTAFYGNDDSGRVGYIEATCGVGGALSPSVEDYTCTRDCEAPQLDGSIMGSLLVVVYQLSTIIVHIMTMSTSAITNYLEPFLHFKFQPSSYYEFTLNLNILHFQSGLTD